MIDKNNSSGYIFAVATKSTYSTHYYIIKISKITHTHKKLQNKTIVRNYAVYTAKIEC